MTKEEVSMIGFEIVAYSGDARSKLLLAVEKAKGQNFDEAKKLIDEAQDLDGKYYDRICQFKVSYGADDSQILYPEHSSTEANLKERYPDNVDYILDKNFRSREGVVKGINFFFDFLIAVNTFGVFFAFFCFSSNLVNNPIAFGMTKRFDFCSTFSIISDFFY